ncbi:MAG: glycosyl transferase [Alphaproteobacteria bacterium PA3]|nr:MAG: glycosyl transferase [Alphaproteobacteria bacterium PA3]
MSEAIFTNGVKAESPLALSIATPFFRNDPSELLNILSSQMTGEAVELIMVDDGSQDTSVTAKLEATLHSLSVPASLITLQSNQGRSAARNRLIAAAKAPVILFLDSDMAPDAPSFVAAWLKLARDPATEIAYGGFSTLQVPDCAALALAKMVAEKSDCASASERQSKGALAVATSNLLVRKTILEETPFDAGFSGWGWEDVDWALRAEAKGHPVLHVDIPATHLGLDDAATLLDKFAKAGPNFRRMVERHPSMAALPGTKLAQTLARVPARPWIKAVLKVIILSEALPLAIRAQGARLWRALWAADALS